MAPDINIKIDDDIQLQLIHERYAESLFHLIDTNRHYLSRWLPWVDLSVNVDYTRQYIRGSLQRYADDNGFDCVILVGNQVAGQIGLHYIDSINQSTSIGYWMGESFQGIGIMTQSCKAIIHYCFYELNLQLINIKCADENLRSRAIPERLHFTLTRQFIDREPIRGIEKNYSLYQLTRAQWDAAHKRSII